MVDKMPSVENLVDPFSKTLIRRVFFGHRDSICFKCESSLLYRHDALRDSVRMLR